MKSEEYRAARRNEARRLRRELRFEVGDRSKWPEAWAHVQRIRAGSAGTRKERKRGNP
jgi:hypothetical protein